MASPFNWATYQAPSMTPVSGTSGNYNFYRPADSQMVTGQGLANYLQPGGPSTDPFITANRTVKYDGGLTREMLGNTTNFLNTQLGQGFNNLNDQLAYGGTFGDRNTPTYSPQSKNGYGTNWGNNNPFKIGSF